VTAPTLTALRSIELGGESRDYELRRSARRTLGIAVEPSGALIVTAPRQLSVERIEAVLRRRRDWIRRRLREAETLPLPPTAREWVSGETHRYLGRQYRLKVRRGLTDEVKLVGQFFAVAVREPRDTKQVRRLMERWYLDHARVTFARRMDELVRKTSQLRRDAAPPLLVRKLSKRWGSCSAEGRILMNVDAIRLPLPCIDYLLVHELCHLRVPHHGPEFWRLLSSCMPDWERWRRRLHHAEM